MSDEWVVTMPKLGETVTEGVVGNWLKQVGDTVAFDDPLFEVSTDKVDSEIPSPYDGVILEILVATGETQGQRDSDFNRCVDGELVTVGIVCPAHVGDPDAGCGCARSFVGLNSHQLTTTAAVKEIDLSEADYVEALRSSLERHCTRYLATSRNYHAGNHRGMRWFFACGRTRN